MDLGVVPRAAFGAASNSIGVVSPYPGIIRMIVLLVRRLRHPREGHCPPLRWRPLAMPIRGSDGTRPSGGHLQSMFDLGLKHPLKGLSFPRKRSPAFLWVAKRLSWSFGSKPMPSPADAEHRERARQRELAA